MGNIIVALSVTVLAAPVLVREGQFSIELSVTNTIAAPGNCSCVTPGESGFPEGHDCPGSSPAFAVLWNTHDHFSLLQEQLFPGTVCNSTVLPAEGRYFIELAVQNSYNFVEVPASWCPFPDDYSEAMEHNCSVTACLVEHELLPESANNLTLSFLFQKEGGVEERGTPSLPLSYALLPFAPPPTDPFSDCEYRSADGSHSNETLLVEVACGLEEMELYDQAMSIQECAACPADLQEGLCETCPEDYAPVEGSSNQCFYQLTPDEFSSDEEDSSEDGDSESSATQLVSFWL
ncbi:hypothetical protein QOT17_019375 [Balamuthia mandrillaris]